MGISWPTVLLTLVTQIVVVLVTVRLALGRFREEKLWERRLDAYTSIIRDLHHIKRDASLNFDAEMGGRKLSDATQSELTSAVKSAQADLALHSDIGELLLSKEALAAIKLTVMELATASSKSTSYQGFLDDCYGIADAGLNAFRMIAKRDLNVGAYATIRATWDRRPWRRMPKQAGASLP
jgi:hypothetical protein